MPTTDDLFAAIAAGDAAALDAVLDADPDLVRASSDGVGVLRAACYAGRGDLAPALVDRGAQPDAFDAAALGDLDLVRDLVDADPELVRAVAGDGFTMLHLAAWFGHAKVAELLLGRGSDPEVVAENGSGLRPLHSAAAGGHEVIVHLLLDRGADIESAQAGGVRALHSAAHRGDAAMVRALLDRGADPAAATDDGRTARDLTDVAEVLALLPQP